MIRKCLIGFFISVLFRSVQAQETKLVLPIGHTSAVYSAQFSPDRKKIITASADHTAKIWDAENGLLLLDLKSHTEAVMFAQFSPDGKKILTASHDSTAKIWDAENGKLLSELNGHTSFVTSARFSPEGKKVIAATNRTVKVWDAEKGDLLLNLEGHNYLVKSVQFSPDGKKILTSSEDKTAKVWDAENGELLLDLTQHTSSINSAQFSPDGKKIITASADRTAKVWDAVKGTLLLNLVGHTSNIKSAEFSSDNKKLVTASYDSTAKVWDAEKGTLLLDLKGHRQWINSAKFSLDGKKIVTCSDDSTAKVWNAEKGVLLLDLRGHSFWVNSAQFSSDNKKIVTTSYDHAAKVWSAENGNLLCDLKGHASSVLLARFSPNGKKILTTSYDHTAKIWNAERGTLLLNLKGHSLNINSASFSPDEKKIVTASADYTAKVWDTEKGILVFDLKGHISPVYTAEFSPDGKKIVTSSVDSTIKVWNAKDGTLLLNLKGHTSHVNTAQFSPDSKKIVTASWDNTPKVWDAENGRLLLNLRGHLSYVRSAEFSPDGKKIITASHDTTAKIWDAENGSLLLNLKAHTPYVHFAKFSPDGRKILTSSSETIKVWDAEKGALLFELKGHSSRLLSALFSPDGKKIISASWDNTLKVWNAEKGNLLLDLKGHSDIVFHAEFSPDGNNMVSASMDNTVKIWNTLSGKLLYTFFAVDSSDYLVVDKDFHYDGTPGARKLLYFTCGSELIDLEQVKESLWVPDLAERINKGESINNPKLSELNLCGLTPVITSDEKQSDSYLFNIKPGRGGLGETHLLINGNVTKKYRPDQLKKTNDSYQLIILKSALEPYFIKGQENPIIVKSYTSSNDIFSRGGARKIENKAKVIIAPNLYAVVVGVSNYKGKELQLNYASKDAQDIGNTLSLACKKLLNTDGKQHVFVYNFNTDQDRYSYPEKINIKNIFDTIATKATANDILLIFFAGHGIVEGKVKKQFYLLTSDASSFSDVASTGISTRELIEWIRPEKIKAQKRILILDACNSAEAINELAKNTDFIAVRNTSASDEKKEIERLNDQAGMFVLSASSTNQSAYELGRYSQGLLTYTLLKAIKQQPDILEDKKYLNLSRWFNAAKRSVNEIMNGMGNMGRQDPQVIANTNFNIGIVDQEVMDKIKLADEKPIFSRSEFRNEDNRIDNLKLRNLVDRQLNDASRGNANEIFYQGDYEGSEAYSFSGDYKIIGNDITISIFLIKGGTEIINKVPWQLKGKTDQLELLADEIVKKGIENVEKK